jgi:uncharacterized membrane protein YhhN
MNYFLTLLGFVLFIALGVMKTKKKHAGKRFSYMKYLKDEVATLVVSVISAVILMLLLPDIGNIISPKYSQYVKVLYVMAGFLNYTLLAFVINFVSPKKFIEE